MSIDNATGWTGLLDENLQPISNRQPVQFIWEMGRGTWAVQLNTKHEFSHTEGAWVVAIYDDEDRVIWELPIVSRSLTAGPLLIDRQSQ